MNAGKIGTSDTVIKISIEVTTDEWNRIGHAAKFSERTVERFATDWIMAGVRACEDDCITHQGEVIGDRLEIDELSRECLP
jgi:hypothetical protein